MSCSGPSRIDQDRRTPCGAGDDKGCGFTLNDGIFCASIILAVTALSIMVILLFKTM